MADKWYVSPMYLLPWGSDGPDDVNTDVLVFLADRRVVTGLLAESLKRARDKREPKNVAFVQYIFAALYQ